jgi:hypothetical protein
MRPGRCQFSQLVTISTVVVVLAGLFQIVSSHERAGAAADEAFFDEQALAFATIANAADNANVRSRARPKRIGAVV